MCQCDPRPLSIQKVEIVLTTTQNPARVAQLVLDKLKALSPRPKLTRWQRAIAWLKGAW